MRCGGMTAVLAGRRAMLQPAGVAICGLLLFMAGGCRHVRTPAAPAGERSPRVAAVPPVGGAFESTVVGLYAESDRTATETVTWELPMSGVPIVCAAAALVDARGVAQVAVAPLELGTAVEVQLTARALPAVREFIAVRDPGRLVLVVEGKALGAARVRSVEATGRITLFVELPEDRLPDLVARLQAALTRSP